MYATVAVISFDQIGFDLSVGHMFCRVAPATPVGENMLRPAVAWLTTEHQAALEGLSNNDHRKGAYLRCTTLSMGSPMPLTGAFSLTAQAALAAASAPRKATIARFQ